MGIVTGRGDDGESDLLFGRRVSKTNARLEAIGTVDELNAAIGLVRAGSQDSALLTLLDRVQDRLVSLMGELAVLPPDRDRHQEAGFPSIGRDDVAMLEAEAERLERAGLSFDGWARPGANGNLTGAQLDFARTVTRRAERRVLAIREEIVNASIPTFLNRLSDVLWLWARSTEQE